MFDNLMDKWASDPETLEAAVMALTNEERAEGLRILRKVKAHVYAESEARDYKPYEWDGQTAENILEAFEYAGAHGGDDQTE